jgi:hypothetical protein
MNNTGQLLQLLLLIVVFGTPVFTPLIFWFFWRARNARLRRSVLWMSGMVFITWMSLFGSYLVKIRPYQSGILAEGRSPDGREYFVVQTFTGFVEPYRVSFYMRDSEGVWHWSYLGHDDHSWGDTAVEFSGAEICVLREGVIVKKIPLDAAVKWNPPDWEGSRSFPASFTAKDVEAFHHKRFG